MLASVKAYQVSHMVLKKKKKIHLQWRKARFNPWVEIIQPLFFFFFFWQKQGKNRGKLYWTENEHLWKTHSYYHTKLWKAGSLLLQWRIKWESQFSPLKVNARLNVLITTITQAKNKIIHVTKNDPILFLFVSEQ